MKNFRNLADIDVPLAQHTMVVGEDRSGKSNLLHAMRLILDNTLSADQRRLPPKDFWEGLSTATCDPVRNGEVIEAFLDVTDLQAVRARGRFGGRPRDLTPQAQKAVIDLREEGRSVSDITATLRVSRATVYRALDNGSTR